MTVRFRTKRLEKCYLEHKLAVRDYGMEVGRRYIQRINIIKQVQNLEELEKIPALRCHPLKGDRDGQYGVNLTGFYRLILTIKDDAMTVAQIEEVSKHYDD